MNRHQGLLSFRVFGTESSGCTYIGDDAQLLDVGGLRVQQLPDRLLLVELPPRQRLRGQRPCRYHYVLTRNVPFKIAKVYNCPSNTVPQKRIITRVDQSAVYFTTLAISKLNSVTPATVNATRRRVIYNSTREKFI